MSSGNCSILCYHHPSFAVANKRWIYAKSSTPFFTYCGAVAPGVICLTSSQSGPPFIITFVVGATWSGSPNSIASCDLKCAKPTSARKTPAPIIDSQSVKTTEQGGAKGYDAGKKVNGRKRHILVDTLGLLLSVKVLAANIQDR